MCQSLRTTKLTLTPLFFRIKFAIKAYMHLCRCINPISKHFTSPALVCTSAQKYFQQQLQHVSVHHDHPHRRRLCCVHTSWFCGGSRNRLHLIISSYISRVGHKTGPGPRFVSDFCNAALHTHTHRAVNSVHAKYGNNGKQ